MENIKNIKKFRQYQKNLPDSETYPLDMLCLDSMSYFKARL